VGTLWGLIRGVKTAGGYHPVVTAIKGGSLLKRRGWLTHFSAKGRKPLGE